MTQRKNKKKTIAVSLSLERAAGVIGLKINEKKLNI